MRRAVLLVAILVAVVGLISSLRILVVEATFPSSLRFDKLRLITLHRLSRIEPSLVSVEAAKYWINDKAISQLEYARCTVRRRNAIGGRDVGKLKQVERECLQAIRSAALQSPGDGRLWLAAAMEMAGRDGVTDEVIDALRMSFVTAPREGWVSNIRLEFVKEVWSLLSTLDKNFIIQNTLDQRAQVTLGSMLLSGELPRDVPRAVTLLEGAAASNDPTALEKLGEMYLKGEEVAADAEKAREYLERAILAGHTWIRFELGRALIKGQGVARDAAAGAKLLEAAAETEPWAQVTLGSMLLSGELPRDVPRAVTLLERAAASNDPTALEKLGEMYLKGEEVAADAEKAQAYLKRASTARRGNITR
jgi:hypothetical protein